MSMARRKIVAAFALVVLVVGGVITVLRVDAQAHRTTLSGYFANSNGIYVGDEVRILGVPVGKIESIAPLPGRARITFWFDDKYRVPADAKAVILSPTLISARAIQLTPPYTSGPVITPGTVLNMERTAVPVEWDDLREQLDKLTQTLQPANPGGVSALGAAINTAADNLRGQGGSIRDALIKVSAAFSALGDHSTDIFSTVRNLATVVSALRSSSDVMSQLNQNLAATTGLLANDPNEISNAITELDVALRETQTFVAENREGLGVTSDRLASITGAVIHQIDNVKQLLHIAPTELANFADVYQPAQGALTGAIAFNNFANPISFICGAIQAASRLGAEQSAKLCVQYLAPIIKNRQYNYLPLGLNPIVGAVARPNELTYSEDRLRPDNNPPPPQLPPPSAAAPPAAEQPTPANPPEPPHTTATDPKKGLPGLMVPAGTR